MTILQKIKELIVGNTVTKERGPLTERQLIELEGEIGRKLFGPVPDGHSRDFFCLDERTWIWHEEWRDIDNKPRALTTRYEVQQKGILKVQSGHVYKYIDGEELDSLYVAIRLYYDYCMRRVYSLDPVTNQPLSYTPTATIYS